MNIVVDQDDTIWHLNQAFILWHNRKYGTNVKYSQIKDFNDPGIFGISVSEIADRYLEFYETPFYRKARYIPGCSSVLPFWKSRGDRIFNATSKPNHPAIVSAVDHLLSRMPGVIEEVFYLGRHCKKGSHGKKVDVCRKLGADLFIDDHIDNVIAVSEELKIPCILINHPWNASFDTARSPLIARAPRWSDANVIYFRIINGKDIHVADGYPTMSA